MRKQRALKNATWVVQLPGHVSCPICGRHIIKATDSCILWTALQALTILPSAKAE